MADSDGSDDSDSERSRPWRTERRGDTGDDVAKVAAGVQAGSGGSSTIASGGGRGGNSRRDRDSNIDHDRSRSRRDDLNHRDRERDRNRDHGRERERLDKDTDSRRRGGDRDRYPKIAAEDNLAMCFTKMFASKKTREGHVRERQEKKDKGLQEALMLVKLEAAKTEEEAKRSARTKQDKLAAEKKLKGRAAQIARKKRLLTRTVFERMDDMSAGPFSLLLRCLRSKQRVRVRIRRMRDVRGTCEGVLAAFDKHMNLALVDVTEHYVTTELAPGVHRSEFSQPEYAHLSKRQQTKLMRNKVVEVRKTRRIPQLFVKGDSVIVVAAIGPLAPLE